MRDNYLEVEDYPFATFEGVIDEVGSAEIGYEITASGTFDVHGVARQRSITCGLTPEGQGCRVLCAFEVLLGNHDIAIPQVMFLKLAEEIRLELDFSLHPVG